MCRRFAPVILAVALLATACGVGDREIPAVVPLTSQQTAIYAADGTEITRLEADENREVVPLNRIPTLLQNAVVAIEDERFWEHNGVDIRGIARAAVENTESGDVSEGGSTITQQYVKTALLSPERTLERKVEEATLAMQLEETHTKDYILEQYLNTIFFGNRSYGVQMAAKRYFGRDVGDLTLAESAMLAGAIQAPSRFDPYVNAEATQTRRDEVLDRMAELGYITIGQRDAAKATSVTDGLVTTEADEAARRYPAAHFVEEVKRFIRTDERFGATPVERNELLVNGGLRIYTTIDLAMQAKAENAVNEIYPRQGARDPDVGLVAIEPRTGYVRAMYGGYDYFDQDTAKHSYAQLNLAVGTGRQVGSTFKAIALAAALSNGISIDDTFPAPSGTTIKLDGYQPWKVTGHALGKASLTECTIDSANTCFANLIADPRVLPTRVTEYAAKMGIDTNDGFQTVPSSVLGTNDNTVLEMTAAYDTF
ncbi:MAG TPA: transglycosylase domain-containing protein, partial [Microthrixaceae bacterium]|nr:transglycosylase domain-containing protein [Microthrixaceae bacterium]